VRVVPGRILAREQADGSNPGADYIRVALVFRTGDHDGGAAIASSRFLVEVRQHARNRSQPRCRRLRHESLPTSCGGA